jgi:hypothetical protein
MYFKYSTYIQYSFYFFRYDGRQGLPDTCLHHWMALPLAEIDLSLGACSAEAVAARGRIWT